MRLNTIKYSIAIGLDQSVGEFVAVKVAVRHTECPD